MPYEVINAGGTTNADTVDGYHAGNASGNVPVSNGTVNTNLNADLLDGKHASYFQAMIDQKVDEFIVPLNDDTVVWHKVGELTTDIGTRRNNLTLLVSGVSDIASNKPGVDVVQISTRGGVSVDVYSLIPPGARTQTYGYVNNTSTGKTEIWVKRDPYTYDTHFAVLNVYDDYGGATYGNLASSSTEPSGIVYVDIKPHWTSGVDLTNATSDYMLQVGEEAYISFSNTTSVPLRIATQSGTIYEVIVTNSGGYNNLLPNNSSYSGQFGNARMYIYWNGSQIDFGYGGGMSSDYFKMYFDAKRFLIFNDLTRKGIVGQYCNWSTLHVGTFVSWWKDTTTPWTSLGTMTFEYSSSGTILVRRLV